MAFRISQMQTYEKVYRTLTAALLTSAFERRLRAQGFYVVKSELSEIVDIFSDSVLALMNHPYSPTDKLKYVGTLPYKNGAVDYDELQKIIHSHA